MQESHLYFVDNLRIVLITLVIMQHLSVTYGGVGSWYYYDGEPDQISSIVLTIHNAINQSFFMGFLFLISGYFTAGSYDRKGPWRFVKSRLLRLGVPWLFYFLVIDSIVVYVLRVEVYEYDGSIRGFLASHFARLNIANGPVWFNEALLIFTILDVFWRRLTGTATEQVRDDGRMPGNLAIATTALALGAICWDRNNHRPAGVVPQPIQSPEETGESHVRQLLCNVHFPQPRCGPTGPGDQRRPDISPPEIRVDRLHSRAIVFRPRQHCQKTTVDKKNLVMGDMIP